MPVTKIVNRRRAGHTAIPNNVLQHPELSLKAKGLLSLMLSFPDDWEYNLSHLGTLSKDGRDATRSAFEELRKWRYVLRRCTHDGKGLWDCNYLVSDEPFTLDEAERFETGGRI